MDEARRASERLAARGDGAAWWVAQLRSGAISRADLELAAWVGDPDVRAVLGPSVFAADAASFEGTVRGLGLWGLSVLVQALWWIAEPHLGALERDAPADLSALRDGVLAWCRGPSDGPHEQIRHAVTRLFGERQPRESPALEALTDFEWSALALIGLSGPWFNQGARDPRRAPRIRLPLGVTPDAEARVRERLLSMARSGGSLAWVSRCEVPFRPCPAPGDPDPASATRIAALSTTELELAAWLGEPTARRLLGTSALCRWPGSQGWPQGVLGEGELVNSDVLAWLRDIGRWGSPWRELAQLAVARVALTLLEPKADAHAKAWRLLDAVDRGADGAELRRLLDEVDLVRPLINDPSRLRGEAEIVQSAVALMSGAEWTEVQWSGRQSMAIHSLRDRLGAVVQAVRSELLSRLLDRRGRGPSNTDTGTGE